MFAVVVATAAAAVSVIDFSRILAPRLFSPVRFSLRAYRLFCAAVSCLACPFLYSCRVLFPCRHFHSAHYSVGIRSPFFPAILIRISVFCSHTNKYVRQLSAPPIDRLMPSFASCVGRSSSQSLFFFFVLFIYLSRLGGFRTCVISYPIRVDISPAAKPPPILRCLFFVFVARHHETCHLRIRKKKPDSIEQILGALDEIDE